MHVYLNNLWTADVRHTLDKLHIRILLERESAIAKRSGRSHSGTLPVWRSAELGQVTNRNSQGLLVSDSVLSRPMGKVLISQLLRN